MGTTTDIGKWGEQVATDYLVTQGFAIMNNNARVGHKEVDIVAMKGDAIHFIEVKTRSNPLDNPLEAIDSRKIRRICRFADSYVRTYNLPHRPQFDAIAVTGDPANGVVSFEHIQNAFYPPLGR